MVLLEKYLQSRPDIIDYNTIVVFGMSLDGHDTEAIISLAESASKTSSQSRHR
jgi:hypothetical protein